VDKKFLRQKKGVALIIAVGILALVAMIATSFAINMQMEYKAVQNFVNQTQAEEMARAGVDRAVAEIRNWAASNSYSLVMADIAANYSSPVRGQPSGGSYQVYVERQDQEVNINNIDETDYPWIETLAAAGLSYDDIAKIIDYVDQDSSATTQLLTSAGRVSAAGDETNAKDAPFATVEEVRLVLKDDGKYNSIKDLITIYAPLIQGGLICKGYTNSRETWSRDTIFPSIIIQERS
jgi:general secretion pathway protein K